MKKALIAALLAIPLLGALKKRQIIRHLTGKTGQEAREMILSRATPRVGPDNAEAIADRILTRMAGHGLLAEPSE